jgi:hypothetical protein
MHETHNEYIYGGVISHVTRITAVTILQVTKETRYIKIINLSTYNIFYIRQFLKGVFTLITFLRIL